MSVIGIYARAVGQFLKEKPIKVNENHNVSIYKFEGETRVIVYEYINKRYFALQLSQYWKVGGSINDYKPRITNAVLDFKEPPNEENFIREFKVKYMEFKLGGKHNE